MGQDRALIGGVIDGFTREEDSQAKRYSGMIMSRVGSKDPNYSVLEREVMTSVKRDLQAKRIAPNVRVPSRLRNPLGYIRTGHDQGLSWFNAARSYFAPGSWTSSGGSFKLAEDAGYDIVSIITQIAGKNRTATFVEVGAGYAGFKSDTAVGISKLVRSAGSSIGDKINIHFTNLTPWHNNLTQGVTEHPGYAARDIEHLKQDGVNSADIIYSQCAAYFEPRLAQFVSGAAKLLNTGGYLIFNGPVEKNMEILEAAKLNRLALEKKSDLGGNNGRLYIFRKG